MQRHAERAARGIDQKARPWSAGIQTAIVPQIAIAQAERAALAQRVAAQHDPMGDEFARPLELGPLLPGCGVEVAAVEGTAIVADAVQAIGV